MSALQEVMKHYELTEWEDEHDEALATFTAAKAELAALEAVAEAARLIDFEAMLRGSSDTARSQILIGNNWLIKMREKLAALDGVKGAE